MGRADTVRKKVIFFFSFLVRFAQRFHIECYGDETIQTKVFWMAKTDVDGSEIHTHTPHSLCVE